MDTLKPAARPPFPGRFYDTNFLNEYGRLETLRSARYNTGFSLVLMVAESQGGSHVEYMKKLAAVVIESMRSCDVVGLVGENRMAAILPETDHFGSLTAVRKIKRAATRLDESYPDVDSVVTSATFPRDGRGFGDLMTAAVDRAGELRGSLWVRLDLEGKLFWEIVAELFSTGERNENSTAFDAGEGQGLPSSFMDGINAQVLREVSRAPDRRGILYMAPRQGSRLEPFFRGLSEHGTPATRVFVAGSEPDRLRGFRNAVPILVQDQRISETSFTFHLSENSGYALLMRENWGGTYSCFHTSDETLVAGLITGFQKEYSLQEQLG